MPKGNRKVEQENLNAAERFPLDHVEECRSGKGTLGQWWKKSAIVTLGDRSATGDIGDRKIVLVKNLCWMIVNVELIHE